MLHRLADACSASRLQIARFASWSAVDVICATATRLGTCNSQRLSDNPQYGKAAAHDWEFCCRILGRN